MGLPVKGGPEINSTPNVSTASAIVLVVLVGAMTEVPRLKPLVKFHAVYLNGVSELVMRKHVVLSHLRRPLWCYPQDIRYILEAVPTRFNEHLTSSLLCRVLGYYQKLTIFTTLNAIIHSPLVGLWTNETWCCIPRFKKLCDNILVTVIGETPTNTKTTSTGEVEEHRG